MKNERNSRARQRLDERLLKLKPEEQFRPPPKGWLRAIRTALGMTGVQFAKRLGVTPQSVDALEKSEASGSIELKSLRKAAALLDCTLVYALVPNSSLESTVQTRARMLAIKDLARASHSMKLEDQETRETDQESRIEEYIRDALRDRDLWNQR